MGTPENLKPGDEHYRSFVGYIDRYDTMAASQFNLLASLGLRESHSLLDFGCGSLRAGRLFINYLLPKKYTGVEPNKWLVDEGIKNEVGYEIVKLKDPSFLHFSDFDFSQIKQTFDFIIAKSIFTHSSLKNIEKAIQGSGDIMNKDCLFLATFILGRSDYEEDEWVYPGVVTYRFKTIKKIAEKYGLKCRMINWRDPQNWIVFYQKDISQEKLHLVDNIEQNNHLPTFIWLKNKILKGLSIR